VPAIGSTYASLLELKKRVGVIDGVDDDQLTRALEATTWGIEEYCERQFNKDDAATPRVYVADDACGVVFVDDFHAGVTPVVETDNDGDGVFETVWPALAYQLEPLNGVVNGRPGWPCSEISAVGSLRWPVRARASVRVTAAWGWAAVPAPVKEACFIVAEEIAKLKDAPFGVAGFGEYGAMRVRRNTAAVTMIDHLRRNPIKIA
jgi:hypothetical protein